LDKRSAISLIQDTLENPFDKRKFAYLVSNMLDHIETAPFIYRGNLIPDAYEPYISTLERIGKYKDREGNKIDLLIVRLKKETSLERARTMQRNFIAWYLNGSRGDVLKDAALAAFVSPDTEDWRFSLVKMDYRLDTSGEKVKVKKEITPARRWSFLVGTNEKSHTAQSRLVSILANDKHDPTLKEIEQAFDIETVTKEFFLKYRELFLHTKEELDKVVEKDPKIKADFEAKGVDAVNFAKKLLGQIIFLYFLQKKGWFGVGRDNDWGTGSKHFLRELFEKKHGDYNNFFNDILEPLFYEALRTGEDRKHEDYYYSRFNCKIPFLNGGLFDPIGNYDWVHTDILLPNKLFSNQTKEGDIGTGILDVFDRYNFTVKEDEPLEKEVAIDPELLGKSYEKFNAIRPDNYAEFKKALKSGKKGEENKFNKKFGVYYTPREIVHYMCQQSLINYLDTAVNTHKESIITKPAIQKKIFGPQSPVQQTLTSDLYKPIIPKKDIETLIHAGEQFSENEARVLSKGRETKTYSHQLPESIRRNAKLFDDKLAEITVCDPAVGSGAFPVGMMSEIVKTRNVLSVFIDDKKRKIYNFKRQCIEHSLYGVDIDPGAVEIAKLRLWLSLVVDEDDIKNIKPLPNLDYKIMQGNSLIELLSTESLVSTIDHKRTELAKELKILKDELFNSTIPTQKENKRREIDILMKKLFGYDRDKQIKSLKDGILAIKSQQRLFEDDKDKREDEKKTRGIESRIEEIKNIDVPGPNEHFEWHVNYSEIFQAKGGFDVVIANPPYVQLSKVAGVDDWYKKRLKDRFNTSGGRLNTFIFFTHLGLELLKPCGNLAFIIPNTILTQEYYRATREHLLKDNCLKTIVQYTELPFENAIVENVTIIVTKEILDSYLMDILVDNLSDMQLVQRKLNTEFLTDSNFSISVNKNALIDKIFTCHKQTLGEFCDINQAIALKGDRNLSLRTSNPDGKYYKKLDGKNIGKYWIKWDGVYLDYKLSRIHSCKRKDIFQSNEKLFFRRVSEDLMFAYDNEQYFALNTLVVVNLKKAATVNLKHILAIMNSRVMNYIYKRKFKSTKKVFSEIQARTVSQLPIAHINPTGQAPLIALVDQILAITKDEDYMQNPQKQAKVKSLGEEIDQLVYKLYDLTPEEIKIVEGKDDNAD